MDVVNIPDFSGANILVVGDVMLDRYWQGDTRRISPEAPVQVVKIGHHYDRPGGSGNVAANLSALGAKVSLLAPVGVDEAGQALKSALEKLGVTCQLHGQEGYQTTTKLRVLSRQQQLIRLDFEETGPGVVSSEYLAAYSELLAQADVLILSDYNKGALTDVANLIAEARLMGKPVIVDPKGEDYSRYRGASVLTPNMSEFLAETGPCIDEDVLNTQAQALMSRLQLECLLLTRSEQGMTIFETGQLPQSLPTEAREVYDVTGAGDTVVALVAAGLASGLSKIAAARLANLAAGVVVGKLGAATVNTTELRQAARQQFGVLGGALPESVLLDEVARARASGQRIVMTNGCFDLLHPGHIRYLEQAKKLGDRLLIAVNDDASVKSLKGEGRPVNKLEDRAAMLNALGCVDWVAAFTEDTPERLICAVKPDCLVKGGDYNPDEIAGAECVRRAGGEVRVLDFMEGYSSTDIMQRIRHQKPVS